MLSTEQIDNWLTDHPPTEETAPKYADLRCAEGVFRNTLLAFMIPDESKPADCFSAITNAARDFIQSIDYNAPDCADKTAAIRCVRLARNAANEAVMAFNDEKMMAELRLLLIQTAVQEAFKARWQACTAIACGGK